MAYADRHAHSFVVLGKHRLANRVAVLYCVCTSYNSTYIAHTVLTDNYSYYCTYCCYRPRPNQPTISLEPTTTPRHTTTPTLATRAGKKKLLWSTIVEPPTYHSRVHSVHLHSTYPRNFPPGIAEFKPPTCVYPYVVGFMHSIYREGNLPR